MSTLFSQEPLVFIISLDKHPTVVQGISCLSPERQADATAMTLDVPEAQMIQGLVTSLGTERRVYVVTSRAPTEFPDFHDRWPRRVTKPARQKKSPPCTRTEGFCVE